MTNVGYIADKTFWVEDANGAHRTYLPDAVTPAPVPGDEVSFTVNAITNYFGELEITALSDWTVVSSGNPVHVGEGTGVALDYATMGRKVYDVYGEITGELGECGGTNYCWELTHGGVVSEVRTGKSIILGDCVHLVAPVNYYDDNALYDIGNWDWMEYY